MKSLSTKRKIITLLFLVTALSFMGSLTFSRKTLAFSTTTPIQASAPETNSANINGSGNNIQPWFAVGEGAYDGTYSYAKVYVPTGGSATLTVVQGDGVCGIDVGSPNVTYETDRLNASENLIVGNGGGQIGTKTNNGSCGSLTFNLSGGTKSSITGHSAYDVYYFQATITGPGVGDNEKNFRLSVGGGGLIGLSRPVANLGTKPWFGIYMRDAPSRGGNNWDFALQLAPRCSEDVGGATESIAVHDVDWQVYNQPNLEGLVDKDDRNASGYNWSLAPPGRPSSDKLQNDWPAGNGSDANLTYNSNSQYRYLLEFKDIDWHNTIQISLPYDQFDAQPSVGQACGTCAGSCQPPDNAECVSISPSNSNPDVGSGVQIQVRVKNTGSSPWNSNYLLRQTAPPGADKNVQGSVAVNQTQTFTYSIQPRASPQTVTFEYRMVNANGKLFPDVPNPLCQTKVAWKACSGTCSSRGGGFVNASCTNSPFISYTGDAFTPDASGNVQNGQPRNWSTIPGAFGGNNFNSTDQVNYVRAAVFFSSDNSDGAAGLTTNDNGYVIWIKVTDPSNETSPLVVYETLARGSLFDPSSTGGLRPQYNYTISVRLASDNFSDSPNYDTVLGTATLDDTPCLKTPGQTACGGFEGPIDYEPDEVSNNNYDLQFVVNSPYGAKFPILNGLQDYSGQPGGNARNYSYSLVVSGGGGVNASANAPPGGTLGTIDGTALGETEVPISIHIIPSYTGSVNISFYFGNTGAGSTNHLYFTCNIPIQPKTRPYFKSYQGDISAGGAFLNNSGQCSAPAPANAGRILGFARPDNNNNSNSKGASDDFGAIALGLIQGDIGGPHGFYSGAINNSARYNTFSFANTGSGLDQALNGGLLVGNPPPDPVTNHCVSDYFDSTPKQTVSPALYMSTAAIDLSNLPAAANVGGNGQYFFKATGPGAAGGSLKITAPAGYRVNSKISIYVIGTAYIDSNITYGSWDPLNTDAAGTPYLAIIANGNITVDPFVTSLDGLYIAQGPAVSDSSGGIFATCSRSTDVSLPAGTYELNHDCLNNQLTVNGAVIAGEVKLLRSEGTLWKSPGNNERPENSNTGNSAEIFNFVPSMLIASPNFQSESSGAVTPGLLQGLFSLPPVF